MADFYNVGICINAEVFQHMIRIKMKVQGIRINYGLNATPKGYVEHQCVPKLRNILPAVIQSVSSVYIYYVYSSIE